jgi:hypothetical protein
VTHIIVAVTAVIPPHVVTRWHGSAWSRAVIPWAGIKLTMTSTVGRAVPRNGDELDETIGAAAENLARIISFAINFARAQGLDLDEVQYQLRALVRREPEMTSRLTHATAERILAVLTASSSQAKTLH